MTKIRCVKGMHDILPQEIARWQKLESIYRDLVARYGYREIRTPVVESQDLFVRGIGDTTDIVEKEMYAFEDKGGARLALRPEGTASVIRSFLQHNISSSTPISKLFYVGPMFRRERPARGRYRQFYQAGAELIGVAEPTADAELISMAVSFLQTLGIDDVCVEINSLGDGTTRLAYRQALVDYFGGYKTELCDDCNRRLTKNPLRLLDCKVAGCVGLRDGAPSVLDYLDRVSAEHFSQLKKVLDVLDVKYLVVPTMVRGLDYYTRTIFEIKGGEQLLGAQATLVGGGRYDGLVEQLGGRPTPTVGFAFGIERLLLVLGERFTSADAPAIMVIGVGEGALERAMSISQQVRTAGFKVETSYRAGSLRSQLKRADKLGAQYALLTGEDEAAAGVVLLRDLFGGEQELIELRTLGATLKERIGV